MPHYYDETRQTNCQSGWNENSVPNYQPLGG